jgi:hypothetical protein
MTTSATTALADKSTAAMQPRMARVLKHGFGRFFIVGCQIDPYSI